MIDNGIAPTNGALVLLPLRNGTRIEFADIPPETHELRVQEVHDVAGAFGEGWHRRDFRREVGIAACADALHRVG